MDPEAGVDGETPVQFLLPRAEVACRLGHRDDLRLIDSIRSPMDHDVRLPAGENVLHPISTFAIGQGDQKAVVVLDRYDRSLVGPTRTASNVTDDRGTRFLRPGRSHGEWPRRLAESAQGCLDGSLHTSRVPRVDPSGSADRPD